MALAGSTGAHGYRRGCRVVRSSVVLVGRSGDGLDGGPIASFDAGNPRTRGCGPWALLRADPLVVSGFRGIGILCASAECAGSRNRDGSVGSAGADVRGYQTRRYRRRHFHGASPSYLGSHRGTLVCNGVGIVHGHNAGARVFAANVEARVLDPVRRVGSCLCSTVSLQRRAAAGTRCHRGVRGQGDSGRRFEAESFQRVVLCRCFRVRGPACVPADRPVARTIEASQLDTTAGSAYFHDDRR